MPIEQTFLTVANNTAQGLITQGQQIIARRDSPIANLVELSLNLEGRLLSADERKNVVEPFDTQLGGVPGQNQETVFDIMLETTISGVYDSVTGVLGLIRSTVSPMISDLSDAVNAYMSAGISQELKASLPTIKTFSVPAPLLHQELVDEISSNAAEMAFDFTQPTSLPSLTTPEIVERLLTGSPQIDEAIRQWLSGLAPSVVEEAWQQCFCRGTSPMLGSMGNPFRHVPTENALTGLICYLAATKMTKDIPEEASVSASVWADYMHYMKSQAARSLTLYMTALSSIGADTLIHGWDDSNIYVDANVFDRFIQSGGSQDAILGAYVCGHSRLSLQSITEMTDDLMRSYARYHADRQQMIARAEVMLTSQALRVVCESEVMNRREACFGRLEKGIGDLPTTSVVQTSSWKRFIQTLENCCVDLNSHHLKTKGVVGVITAILSKGVFFDTDVGFIFEQADAVEAADPSLSPDEVIEYAASSLALVFVSKQLALTVKAL